ncbi:MAG: efflux RND transporter permease subunit [Desulfobacterota bacterium]|nr:efflux RND transporter permease subunit [Thermodesulfobacteriota bacterium]
MKRVIAFFIRYPVWSNVLVFSLIGFGVVSARMMRYSFFPEIKPDIIIIQVEYLGGSPEEVEEGVVQKIEEAIEGIENIERVTSVSRENFAQITVEIYKGADTDKALQDIKNAVDSISSFPQNTEKPVIFERRFRDDVMSLVLLGDTDLFNLKHVADTIRDDLLATEEISQVTISGLPRLEFSVEVSEAELRRYLLTLQEVAAAIGAANINLSGGTVQTPDEEILIRTWGKKYYAKELHSIVVRGNPDGTVIRLGNLADIKEKWEEIPDKTWYNGRNAVKLKIEKTAQEDILAIANRLKNYIETFNATHPGMQLVVLDDRTVSLTQRLELLTKNGIFGFCLVIVVLGFFMNLYLSFWVSVGIPTAFAGMFIVIALLGTTINAIALFGMIIVVGMLVDDAIVVGENIYAHYERGEPAIQAAIDGTYEMLGPVFTSVFTTMIAFVPFFFLDGFLGKFIWNLALVVIVALAFSMLEAFFILPSHLAHSKGLHPHTTNHRLRRRIEAVIDFFTYRAYAPVLRATLRHKWITVIAPVAFVLLTVGLVRGGFIGLTFFPFIDFDTLPINLSLVAGTQEHETERILAGIEQVCWEVNKQLTAERPDGRDVILGILREVGSNDFGDTGSHAGKLTLQLLDGEVRQMDSFMIAGRIRDAVGPVPEAREISYGRFSMFGKPISISFLGRNFEELRKACALMVAELKNFKELADVTDSEQEGRREIAITLKPRAHALGLQLRDIVGQVRQGFYGLEAQRIQRGKDEIRVWVRYNDSDRAAQGFLDQMRIRTPNGGEYPFSELAEYTMQRTVSHINHLDRKREIRVDASLADEETPLVPILEDIRENVVPRVLSQVNGVTVSYEGQSREQQKVMRSIFRTFPIAFIGILITIVLVFRSYLQGLLVCSLIPLGLMGAFWGHGFHGLPVNTLSLYGLITLAGVIVNDGIVLVDQINRNIITGKKLSEAVYHAAISRLRPILSTTLTTAIGLGPLILEKSRQAKFLVPMAISISYGLLFGTFILLLILPAGFLCLNRVRMLTARIFGAREVSPESVEPALQELWKMEKLSHR